MATWTFWWTRVLHMFMIDTSIFGTAKADPGPSQRGDLRAIRDPKGSPSWDNWRMLRVMTPVQIRISTACNIPLVVIGRHIACVFLWISRHANYVGFNLWAIVAHSAGHKAANQSTICEPHQENGRNGFQDPPHHAKNPTFSKHFLSQKRGHLFLAEGVPRRHWKPLRWWGTGL